MESTIFARVVDNRGFEVRFERCGEEEDYIYIVSAYKLGGGRIGDVGTALRLIRDMGIEPELIDDTYNVCSIGFCEKEEKWYGWSHRAIYGFGIGYIAKNGDIVVSSEWTQEYLQKHPEADKSVPVGFEAKTLEDCKQLAIAFAYSVS